MFRFFNSPCMIKETRRNIENMKVRCYLEHLDKHVFIPDIPNMRKANKTIAAAAADKTTIGESYEERIARMSSSKNLARKQCRLVDKDKSVNWLNCKATPPYERETSTTFMQDMNNGIVKNVLHKFIKLNENKEPVEDYLGFKTNTFEKTNKTNKTDNSFLNNKMKKEQTSILGRKLNIQPAWFHPVPSSKENLRAKRKAPKFKSSHTQTSPATSTTNILLNVISSQSDEIRVALKFQENDKKNDDQMVLKFAKDEDVTVKKCIEYFEGISRMF